MLDEYLNLYESIGEEVNLSFYQLALDVLIERVRRHELNLIVSPGNPLLEKGTLTHRSRPAAPTLRPV